LWGGRKKGQQVSKKKKRKKPVKRPANQKKNKRKAENPKKTAPGEPLQKREDGVLEAKKTHLAPRKRKKGWKTRPAKTTDNQGKRGKRITPGLKKRGSKKRRGVTTPNRRSGKKFTHAPKKGKWARTSEKGKTAVQEQKKGQRRKTAGQAWDKKIRVSVKSLK